MRWAKKNDVNDVKYSLSTEIFTLIFLKDARSFLKKYKNTMKKNLYKFKIYLPISGSDWNPSLMTDRLPTERRPISGEVSGDALGLRAATEVRLLERTG